MTWLTLSASDARLTTDEKSRLEDLSPQVTLQQALDAAANMARGYIGARNALAPAPQIPPEAKDAVLAVALANYLTQVPGYNLTDDRKTARDNGIKFLQDIGAGKVAVTKADVTADSQPSSPGPSFTDRDRQFDPDSEDGI